MPLFNRETPEEKAERLSRELEAQKNQDDCVQALQHGKLPPLAEKRLKELESAAKKLFSSDLSTREFLLTSNKGIKPIAQVMGSAFFSITRRVNQILQTKSNKSYRYSTSSRSYRASDYSQRYQGELAELTEAHESSRRMALYRLGKEAALLGASGVIGVRIQKKVHGFAGDTVEFTAFGTAVHLPGWDPTKRTFASLLSVQEFWQLWEAGYEPKGIALGVCSYHDCTDSSTIYERSYNQEIYTYTLSFYQARKLAMERLRESVKFLEASGCVGAEIEYEFQEGESEMEVAEGASAKYLHFITNFVAMGNAIAPRQGRVSTEKRNTLLIYDLKQRKNSG